MATVLLFLIISAAIFDHGFSCILILEAAIAAISMPPPLQIVKVGQNHHSTV